MLLNQIVWDVRPEIFFFPEWIPLIGGNGVRWYGVLWALAFYFGYLIFDRFVKKEKLPEGYLDSLTIYSAVGIIVGARLGHCFFYEPAYYFAHPIDILKIWQGGLASHGAAIGGIIGLYLFSQKVKQSMLHALDRFMIPTALGGALVRIGNLMNSEIYGVATTKPWGFIFVRDGQSIPKHPTQIYEAISYLLIFVLLQLIYIKSNAKPKPGLLFGLFMLLVFGTRFFIEYVKEPQVSFEVGMTLNMGQLLSIPFILIGLSFIGWAYYGKRGK